MSGTTARAEVHILVDAAIRNLQSLRGELTTTGRTAETAFDGSGKSMQNMTQNLNTVGTGLTVFGAAITGIFAVGAKSAMDFEQQMSAVGAVSGATADELDRAREVVLQLGYETTLSAGESAMALEEMVKAGISLEDALDGVLAATISLAEATGTDLMQATETVSAAMTIFNLEADQATAVVDAMSQSANASALDIGDWQLALKYAGPIVAALGYEIDDLAVMMMILGDAGIKGEQGATALRNILTNLANATPEVTAAFEQYGVALFDTEGNLRDMKDITADLAVSWDTMSESERIAFAEMVAGKQGMASFMTIMDAQTRSVKNGSNAFDEAAVRMEEAGTTAEAAERRMDNLAGSFEELKGTLETLAIAFMSGLLPVIRAVVDGLSGFLQFFLSLPQPLQTAIAGIVGLTGVIATLTGGTMLAAVKIGELVTAFKGLIGLNATGAASTATLASKFTLLLNPVTLVVVAVAALAAGFVILYTRSEAFRELIGTIGRSLDTLSGGALSAAIDKLQEVYEVYDAIFGGGDIDKSATLDIGAISDTTYDDWVVQPDGTIKNAELDITATGSGPAFITKVENQAAADGFDYTLNLDVTGDGVPDALKILDSVDQGGGKYAYTVELDGEQYYVWYDEVTGQTVYVKAEAQLDTKKARDEMSELERRIDNVRTKVQGILGLFQLGELALTRAIEALNAVLIIFNDEISTALQWVGDAIGKFIEFVGPIGDAKKQFGLLKDIITGDWSSIDWRDILDIAGLEWAIPIIETTISLIEKLQGLQGIEGRAADDPQYDETVRGYNEKQDPKVVRQRHSATKDAQGTYISMKPGDTYGMAIDPATIASYNSAAAAVNVLADTFDLLPPAVEPASISMDKMASSSTYTDVAVMNAGGGISASAGLIGSAFGSMAESATSQSALAAANATANFGALNTGVTSSTLGAQLGVSASMAALASNVTSQSSTARANAVSQFSTMNSGVAGQLMGMQAATSLRMALVASTVDTQASSAKSNASSQFSSMNSSVAGHLLGMATATSLQMGLMASTAQTKGESVNTNMSSGLKNTASSSRSILSQLAGIVSGAGANAAINALIAGQNISGSFANGMESMLSRIRAAANAMVAEANRAIIAKAMIASPSKVFKRLGEYVGEGFEQGILSQVPAAAQAAERLVNVPGISGGYNAGAGALASGLTAGSSSVVTNHFWITVPPDAWERMNADVAKSAKFVQNWKQTDAISQYIERR